LFAFLVLEPQISILQLEFAGLAPTEPRLFAQGRQWVPFSFSFSFHHLSSVSSALPISPAAPNNAPLAVCSAQSQVTAITLWQFGKGRLLAADFTLPLEPLGTAADGSETTYLYQALNEATVTTTNEAGLLTILTTPVPSERNVFPGLMCR
jgi:hypothetical protein